MKKKFLSAIFAICMVLTIIPMTALADFADTEGHWGKDAIDRWAGEGVLNGKGDGIFDPNGSMTRAEFAQMLCNLMGYTEKAPNTFADVPDDAWYADAVLKLVKAGVLNGVGSNMAAPNAPITREQAAVMLVRAFSLKVSSASLGYADAADVSDWAVGAVAALTEKGMMNGVGGNQVAPQLNINRASVATLIDNMVVEYVTGDKVITGEVNGIIVVAADAKVTFEDAAVNVPVIVAPAAAGAEVELTGTTSAENVVVAAGKVSVTVGKDAAAESVTAAAGKAEIKVEGTAGTVDVAGEGTKVDVSGTVGTVSTGAANTSVAVSGTVGNVEVAKGADKTNITTTSTAKIDSVTTGAENVKVSGTGTVVTVTAEAGSVEVTTKGTEVANEGAGEVKAGDKTVEAGGRETVAVTTSTGGGSSSGGDTPGTPAGKNEAGVVKAPIHDNAASNAIADANLGKVTVTSTGSNGAFNVVIKGEDIMNHTADGAGDGHWVGFGMPIEEGYTYEYTVDGDDVPAVATREWADEEGSRYNTVYFSKDTEEEFKQASHVVVQKATKDEEEKVTAYTVKFDVTFWKADVEICAFDDSTADEIGGPFASAIKAVNYTDFVQSGRDFSAAVSNGTDFALSSLNTDENHANCLFTYYGLMLADQKDIAVVYSTGEGFPMNVTNGNLQSLMAVCLFENTDTAPTV